MFSGPRFSQEDMFRATGDLLPEKDPLKVGRGVEGIGRHGANLVVLQVQVLK